MATEAPTRRNARRSFAVAVLVGMAFLGVLLWLLLSPGGASQFDFFSVDHGIEVLRMFGWTSLTWAEGEALANILAFVPVGLIAALLMPRRAWWLAFLVGPALSAVIETCQYFLIADRVASIDDVLLNTAGASVGVVGGLLLRAVVRAVRQPRTRR